MRDIKIAVIGGLIVLSVATVIALVGLKPLPTAIIAGSLAVGLLLSGPALRWIANRVASAWNLFLRILNKPIFDQLDDLESRMTSQETLLRSIQMRLASGSSDDQDDGETRQEPR